MMKNKLLLAPIVLFAVLFVILPLIYVIGMSFMQKDNLWGVKYIFTLENYRQIFTPVYMKTFITSFAMAGMTTLYTIIIGYPFGYIMAKQSPKKRSVLMLMLVVPFWTNSLVRIYGWIILLKGGGVLSRALQSLHIMSSPLSILYTPYAVVIGMVYALLPFMILAVYSSCLKLDSTLTDASRDLGADRIRSFFDITLRLTAPGLFSGITLVFVPSIGLFFISDLLGGGKIMLLGNVIENQLTTSRNMPFGAALSVIMIIMTFIALWACRRLSGNDSPEVF